MGKSHPRNKKEADCKFPRLATSTPRRLSRSARRRRSRVPSPVPTGSSAAQALRVHRGQAARHPDHHSAFIPPPPSSLWSSTNCSFFQVQSLLWPDPASNPPQAIEKRARSLPALSGHPRPNPRRTRAGPSGGGGGQRRAGPRPPGLSRPRSLTSSGPSPHSPDYQAPPRPPRSFTLTRLCMWLRHSRCTGSDSSASSSNTSPSSASLGTKVAALTQDIAEATAGPRRAEGPHHCLV